MIDAYGMAKNTMPKTFADKMKWSEWKVILINFLKSHTGRNGFPLNYVLCGNANPITRNNPNVLDDYTDRTPLQGNVFIHDAAKVHSYIIRLISENNVAEQNILPHQDNTNVGEDFLALKYFYEGIGANAKTVLAAKNNIQELYYTGKKKPNMWWDEFEISMTNAFAIVDKDAAWQLNIYESKLHRLNNKVRADFLINMKTFIEMQMSATPMTMIYSAALTNYSNTVNQRFHNESTVKSNSRWIQTVDPV